MATTIENHRHQNFMFLTVTNPAAARYNRARLRIEFPSAFACLDADGVPGDPTCGGGLMVFAEGMRVRLTRNVDKDRGFVNGALGVVHSILRKDVFVMRMDSGIFVLVHPIHHNGQCFMPCAYAYATTMRRAQGSTLHLVGLVFDRKCADRGYAYVGASRVKRADALFLVGRVRRTDWLPVGGDAATEQLVRSGASQSTDEDAPSSCDTDSTRGLQRSDHTEEDTDMTSSAARSPSRSARSWRSSRSSSPSARSWRSSRSSSLATS
jgi:hypothetical protein